MNWFAIVAFQLCLSFTYSKYCGFPFQAMWLLEGKKKPGISNGLVLAICFLNVKWMFELIILIWVCHVLKFITPNQWHCVVTSVIASWYWNAFISSVVQKFYNTRVASSFLFLFLALYIYFVSLTVLPLEQNNEITVKWGVNEDFTEWDRLLATTPRILLILVISAMF